VRESVPKHNQPPIQANKQYPHLKHNGEERVSMIVCQTNFADAIVDSSANEI